ncbi:MAG TPA: recombination protein RecR [Candidatus Marinimicrobia bacterium]|nr:recombination protein RecR [Candidatus Neomarinimicrobiota bacterium]
MSGIPPSLEKLAELMAKFPGIGRKSARRIAFSLLDRPREDIILLARAFLDVKDNVRRCPVCNHITESEPCDICQNPRRDSSVICVVKDSMDVLAIEKTTVFHGKYHVLGGLISPLNGIGPDDLSIEPLLIRAKEIHELVFAINSSVEGEMTMHYIRKMLSNCPVSISYLARGIPIGSDLEFVDDATLARALQSRIELKGE